jgi:hypothetical protein
MAAVGISRFRAGPLKRQPPTSALTAGKFTKPGAVLEKFFDETHVKPSMGTTYATPI